MITRSIKFNYHKLISGVVINRIYYHTYDWGFFSNLTTTLQDIANHFEDIDRVDTAYSFSRYKDTQGKDTWLEYFAAPHKDIDQSVLQKNFYGSDTYQHSKYQDLDFTSPNEKYRTSLYNLGYITSFDSNGNPLPITPLANILQGDPSTNPSDAVIVGAPYHFYFGLNNGKTAIDRFYKLYVATKG